MNHRTPDRADLALLAGAVLAWLLGCFWAATAATSLGRVRMGAAETVGGLLSAAAHPLVASGVVADGPPAWLALAAFAVLAASPLAVLATPAARQAGLGQRLRTWLVGEQHGARWAKLGDLDALSVGPGPTPGRLVIGRFGTQRLATEQRHSVIVFGPTGSYKTSGLAVPAIRDWDGPVLCASVKADLLRDTIEHREQRGAVMVFDPTGATGLPSDGWSPLTTCASWPGALRMAQWLCGATHTGGSGGDLDFWYRAAKKLLAPILFAAAVSGRSMADVNRWVDLQDTDEIHRLLQAAGCGPALDAWAARELRDAKQRSSIYTTLETVLDAYQDERVLRDADHSSITAKALLDGGRHALYLCAPADDQDALRTVFSTLILSITTHVYAQATSTRRPLEPPLLLVLDELANVAPVPRLDVLASTGRDQGIQTLSILQDLSQLEERYGPRRARTIINNHHAKLVLAGQSDQATLDLITHLLGDQELQQRSITTAEDRTTTTSSSTYRRLAPAETTRQQLPGQGLLVYGNLPPAQIRLLPWFEDRAARAATDS